MSILAKINETKLHLGSSKHKSEDYKITVAKYYLENDTNYTKTCDIFKCSERSLKKWIERYEEFEENKRLNKKPKKEKVKKVIQKKAKKSVNVVVLTKS